jgi:hypothetical protein
VGQQRKCGVPRRRNAQQSGGCDTQVAVEAGLGGDHPAQFGASGRVQLVPVAVFLVPLSVVHAPIAPRRVIRTAASLTGAAVILLLTLASALTGPATVVAAIAAVCVPVILVTIMPQARNGHRWRDETEMPVS